MDGDSGSASKEPETSGLSIRLIAGLCITIHRVAIQQQALIFMCTVSALIMRISNSAAKINFKKQ